MLTTDSIQKFTEKLSVIRLLCTFPVQWNQDLRKYEKLPLKWFYFCSLTALTLSMSVASVFIIVEKINYGGMKMILELSQVFVSLVIIFYFYFKRENLVSCMNLFLDIDRRMTEFGARISYRAVKYFSILKYAAMLLCVITNNIACVLFTDQDYVHCGVYFVTYNLTFMISSSVLSHFCTAILVAMKRLKTLNNSISNLVLKGNFDHDNRYDKLAYDEYDAAKSLRNISTIHWDIIKLAKLINKTFALQLVLLFFKTFVTALAVAHSIIKKQTGMLVMYDLFWGFFTIAEVIYMLQVCTECIQLSKRSTHLVDTLRARNGSKLNFEKQLFLLQCLHHRLDFSALGLFPINQSVFLKFCAAVVTYALLILQFENLKKNNSTRLEL